MRTSSSLTKFAVDGAANEATAPPRRTRGKNARVGIAVRLAHEDWHRVTELAMREHTSLQRLIVAGLSALMQQRGLPPLSAHADGEGLEGHGR